MHVVRQVLPSEYYKYRTHLKSLDTESKYLRFGYPVTDEIIDRLCDTIESNKRSHILFCVENSSLEFIAIGHVAIVDDMELAFSVLSAYQKQGLGNALMSRVIQWCRINGKLTGHMVCLSSNSVIRHLCHKYGIKMTSSFGETHASIVLDNAALDTYIGEVTDCSIATVDFLSKRLLNGKY